MTWGWTKVRPNQWRFDERWEVYGKSGGRWRVFRDGTRLLQDYPDAGSAMEAVDGMRKAEER